MNIHEKACTVPAEGLSTQALFRLLQDAAGEQCEPLHLSGPDLRKRGLMWVVIRYRVEVTRWPQPGEHLRLFTWPGLTRHSLMPRFYTLRNETGEKLLAASSVWAVADRESRAMVNSEALGVTLEPAVTGEEIAFPRPVRLPELPESTVFTVPAAYLDANGHMNNTYYYTVAEDCIGRDARSGRLREVATEHVSEALCGETMTLYWGRDGDVYSLCGKSDGKTVFNMRLHYEEEN